MPKKDLGSATIK